MGPGDPSGMIRMASCQGQGFLVTVVTAFTGAAALGEEANSEKRGGDGKMKRMLEPSIKLIGEVHRMSMSGVRIQMQCRASNSLARRIEKVESNIVRVRQRGD